MTEVLKGPQAPCSAATPNAARSTCSKAPTGEFGGGAQGWIGNFGSYNAYWYINLPEVAGVSFKLDGVISHQDPTVRNPLTARPAGTSTTAMAAAWPPAGSRPTSPPTSAFDISRDENTLLYSQLLNFNLDGYPGRDARRDPGHGGPIARFKKTCVPLPGMVVASDKRMDVADIGVLQLRPAWARPRASPSNLRWSVADGLEPARPCGAPSTPSSTIRAAPTAAQVLRPLGSRLTREHVHPAYV